MKSIVLILFACALFHCDNVFAGQFYIPEGSVLRASVDDALLHYQGNRVWVYDANGVMYRLFLDNQAGNCRSGKVFASNGDVAQVSICQTRQNFSYNRRRTPVQQLQYNTQATPTPSRQSYNGLFSEKPGLQYDLRGKPNSPFMNVDPMNVTLNDVYAMSPAQFEEYKKRVEWVNGNFAPQALQNDREAARNAQIWMGDTNQDRYYSPQRTISRNFDRLLSRAINSINF